MFTSFLVGSLELPIKLYPNPTPGMLNLQMDHPSGGNFEILVRDLQGRVVFRERVNCSTDIEVQIDISRHESGVYFLEITEESRVLYVERLVKE